MVIVGPYIRGYDFVSKNVKEKNQGMSAKYWFGTDYLGRDLFSRVWMGARASIIIALVATALKLIVGTLYGAVRPIPRKLSPASVKMNAGMEVDIFKIKIPSMFGT